MPTARCKWCNSWLFNEDIGREYIQVKSGMKIQSKFICLKCEMELRKAKNLPTQWESGEEVFLWWIEDKNVAGQREFKVAENGQLMW